jgi:hypothetical protein
MNTYEMCSVSVAIVDFRYYFYREIHCQIWQTKFQLQPRISLEERIQVTYLEVYIGKQENLTTGFWSILHITQNKEEREKQRERITMEIFYEKCPINWT